MRYYAVAAALCIGALAFQAQAGPRDKDFRQASRLYRNGMYERAKDIFEEMGRSGDILAEGYSAICAAKMQTAGFMDELDSYLVKYPESSLAPQVRFEKGLAYFDAGDYAASGREFASFSKEDLRRDQVAEYVFKRAYSDYALQKYPEARERFLTVEKMPFSDYTAPSRFALGYIDYSWSDFDSAIKWFEQAARDPRFSDPSSYYILECRFNGKDYRYVTDNGPEMFEKVPEERKPHLARILSESYLVQGNIDKAKEYFDKNRLSNEARTRSDYFYAGSVMYAIKDYAAAVENFSGMETFADSLGQIASYQMADAYLQLKNKVKAMECFKDASALTFDPEIREDAMFNYAKLAFDLNQDGQAFADYIATYAKSKRGDDIYSYMALSRLAAHDYAGAVEAYDNIDDLSPDMRSNYMKANYLRANQLISSGSWRDAVQCLQAAAFYTGRRDPFNQLSRYWLAESYYNTGKYSEAESVLTDLYNGSALDGHEEGRLLPYNLAYCYFREGNYQNAAKWFDTYLNSGRPVYAQDAGVRRADCDFMRKDYKSAAALYESVLSKFGDPDDVYPYYQLGLAYGLAGERQKKVDALSRVRKASPSANFYPEAMYELGRAYVDLDRPDAASECFEALRANAKDGTYVARALIELGMLARNRRQNDKALGYYKEVVEKLPHGEYTEDAMLAIESIYQAMGEPENYLAYAESVGDGSRKTDAEKEQIYFNSAEQVFLSGNYQKALVSLQKYFEAYPSGSRATEAHFYEAESYMNLGQKENAAESYAKVMTAPDAGSLLEPSILNYSVLSYGLEHYSDAYNGYSMLREKARMDENVFAAKVGMMRSAYRARDYRDAVAAADGVKADKRCDEALGREADFVKAKSLMGTSQRAAALDIFRSLAASPSTDEGAEAAYTLIQNTYDVGDFDKVEKMVYDFSAKAQGQNYWLAKAYIVLGDAFAEQDNFAQARATFESIASGYEPSGPEDDVLDAVSMRLDKLSQMM